MSTVLRASPPPRAARPIPRGRPVEGHAPSPHGFPVLRSISVYRHAVVNTPVARWVLIARGTAYSNRFPVPGGGGLPHIPARSATTLDFSRPAQRSLAITACRLAESPKRPVCLEGSDGFVTSTAAPIATGWSDPVAGWELHPLKTNTSRFTAHRYGVPGTPAPGNSWDQEDDLELVRSTRRWRASFRSVGRRLDRRRRRRSDRRAGCLDVRSRNCFGGRGLHRPWDTFTNAFAMWCGVRLIQAQLKAAFRRQQDAQARSRPGDLDKTLPFKSLNPVSDTARGDPGALGDLDIGDEAGGVIGQVADRLEDHSLGTEELGHSRFLTRQSRNQKELQRAPRTLRDSQLLM